MGGRLAAAVASPDSPHSRFLPWTKPRRSPSPNPSKKNITVALSIIPALVAATQATTDAAQTWNRATGPQTGEAPGSGPRGELMMTDEGGTTVMTEGEAETMTATMMADRHGMRGTG